VTAVYDQFTADAKQVMNLARQSAQRLRHDYLGTEHILYGLIAIDDFVTRGVFTELRVDPPVLRGELDRLVKPGAQVVPIQLLFTPRAKRVLELSIAAANRLGDRHIGTEHFLLGLIQEGEGVAAQALMGVGVTAEGVSGAIAKITKRSVAQVPSGSMPMSRLDEAEAEAVLRIAKRVLERRGEWNAARAVEEAISHFRLDG
jgi:ATP-dependent Clp protease ATP-binding subunit ClpC